MTRRITILGPARNREPASGWPFIRVQTLRRAATSLVWLAFTLSGCQPAGPDQRASPAAATVNPVAAGRLRDSIALEILELDESQGDLDYQSQIYLTSSEELSRLIDALDTELPLQSASRCIPRYRLRFALPNGESKEFSYVCEGGEAILRGEQDFWSRGEVTAPKEFQDQLREVIERQSRAPTAVANHGLTRHAAAGGPRR